MKEASIVKNIIYMYITNISAPFFWGGGLIIATLIARKTTKGFHHQLLFLRSKQIQYFGLFELYTEVNYLKSIGKP